MADALLLHPEREFIDDVLQGSGGDMKKCFQCATCSSVCSLSTEGRPFPRQQMLEAQWGMSEQLMGDPAVWLCHNCGDCTLRCPRGSHPAEAMSAIRSAVIKRLAFPRIMGNLIGSPATALLMLALSVTVLTLVVSPAAHPAMTLEVFAAEFPKGRLEPLFFAVSAVVLVALAVSALRFAKALRASGAQGPIWRSLGPVLVEVVTHRRFAQCSGGQSRRWGHMFVLGGFLGLAVMGTIVGIGSMMGVIDTPLPTLHPLKIFANVCALVIVAGVGLLLGHRLLDREARDGAAFFDWFFLLLLASAALTGVISEVLRLTQSHMWMFSIYFLHLTLVMTLFLCAPYSKFVHFLYRTMAMAATWEEYKSSSRAIESADASGAASPVGPGLHPASS